MMKTPIQKFIHSYRQWASQQRLFSSGVRFTSILLVLTFLLVATESIFYLSQSHRLLLDQYFIAIFLLFIAYLGLEWIIHIRQLFNNSTDNQLSKIIGKKFPKIKDRLLNALQLEEDIKSNIVGKDLAEYAVLKTQEELGTLDFQSISTGINKTQKNIFIASISLFLLLFMFNFSTSINAVDRLIHPQTYYPKPLPFTLTSLNPTIDVLGGDTIQVSIAGMGDLPDSILVQWENKSGVETTWAYENNELYHLTFENVRQDIQWKAIVNNISFFSPWDVIETDISSIFVTDRPIIENVTFSIFPPEYTGEDVKSHPGNISDIHVLAGSKIQINASSTKRIKDAWLALTGLDNRETQINGKNMSITLHVGSSVTAALYCTDENDVENLHPTHYRINVYPDSPPDILVTSPETEFELDESNGINITFQTSDDYGFSASWIEYQLMTPYYLGNQDSTIHRREVNEISTEVKSQQIIHYWDISSLHPEPEDEIHFTIHVQDNNLITGPLATQSVKLIGRYPSIEDLFTQMEEEEEEIEQYTDDVISDLENVQELVEELQLEMLKSEEMTWEQQQKAEESLQQMQEVFNQLEQIQEAVEKIEEQASKNNLVSDQLVEKFQKFNELLDDIMTPELMEAMEKMQEAMQNMDMEQMLDALENFDYDLEEFEDQLDRFIDMFEQAIAEQKIDEVVKRLEKMVEAQESISADLQQDDANLSELASKERRQEEQFKKLKETMKDASEAMEKGSESASEQMDELLNSPLTKETESQIKDTRKELQKGQQDEASESSDKSKEKLENMLNEAMAIQEQFQEETVDEMMDAFLSVVRNVLYISQSQEKLIKNGEKLNSRSPNLPEIASFQNRIKRENIQLMAQMMELSKKTFYITPAISRAIGKTTSAMDKAIGHVEQKQITNSRKSQKKALNGLNETAYLLLSAMEEMKSSGSASGFESYMEQLENMTQQQKGINKGTMQMGQMGMMAQQQMMQGLQGQQQALQKALQELMGDMPGGEIPGSLTKAEQDMEEVIDDFKRRQVTRKTMERQQQILSRMLDSQKSMTQKDYSEKRKSNSGEEIEYDGPTGLPQDKGQRELFLINALESALQEGHSREYQEMMKHYFRGLQSEDSSDK